jgi:hypothetical protein
MSQEYSTNQGSEGLNKNQKVVLNQNEKAPISLDNDFEIVSL